MREPNPDLRCDSPHPVFPETRCNHEQGHEGEHGYTSPVDGRTVEWPADPDDREGQPF